MHKYLPRVHLVKYEDKVPKASFLSDLETHDRKVFTFEETQFIGVTAYQNQLASTAEHNCIGSVAFGN